MEPAFPLFRQPKNVIIEVIKNLPLKQLFKFSLVSSETKNLVSSLGLEASDVDINIWNTIRVAVRIGINSLFLNFYNDSNDPNVLMPIDINIPVAATCDYEDTKLQSSTPFNFSNWMNHINTVFCYTKPLNVYFYRGCERFEIEPLKNTIGNVNFLIVFAEVTNTCSKKVLKTFNAPSELFLHRSPFEDTCQIQQIFIQNCEILTFVDEYSLDDMLLVNSEIVSFSRPISQKQFNQFVKHWIRGSNPRVQHVFLSIDMADFVNGEVYLNGIKCMGMSEDAKREIRRMHSLPMYVDIIQIRRKDGTAAVIGIRKSENILDIHFVVLH
ncbi:hypothetical protein GCK72_008561 [Caenorhabditis remanei]|uniref:F-box domain-containing protein n=1 Tax=Caenorhabditis remanei TaxID=31234 RepID=A0A6A5H0Z9_CAERE|nr:hypothetical protein GCK72_008561 [Caenorhabditis remanei]KAF1760313.1 hypothetical protein GCK72_008561 [Caenorhabditis remanei]